jgi:hypothetical protein
MPPESEFFWVESFARFENPARTIRTIASNECGRRKSGRLPESKIEEIAARARLISERTPEKMLHHGSGWGALELRRRAADSAAPFEFAPNSYPESSLGVLQAPWLELLDGRLPDSVAIKLPGWQTSGAWYLRLQAAEKNLPGGGDHPWLQYQLAVNECKREEYCNALARLERLNIPAYAVSIIERIKACLYTMQKQPGALGRTRTWPNSGERAGEAMDSFINAAALLNFCRIASKQPEDE